MLKKHKKRIIEDVLVLIVASFLAFLTGFSWEYPLLEKLSSLLFQIFLPGIWLAMQFSGGPHNSSEVNVIVGVFIQFILLYWLIRKVALRFLRSESMGSE